jgi:hypothetical protein
MPRLHPLYPQKAAPTWSGLVARLNDPYLIAVMLLGLRPCDTRHDGKCDSGRGQMQKFATGKFHWLPCTRVMGASARCERG